MTYTVQRDGPAEGLRHYHVVLDGVDLRRRDRDRLALLGPNGAGKTTMVRILATLIRPDAGTGHLAGHDLLPDPEAVHRSISLTGQYAAVDEMLTGRENLEMMAPAATCPPRSAAPGPTSCWPNSTSPPPATGGPDLLRRHDPPAGPGHQHDRAARQLVFLDEPTTGLDPRSREQVWGTVRGLVERGVTILLTTQYLEEADQLADTIACSTAAGSSPRAPPTS